MAFDEVFGEWLGGAVRQDWKAVLVFFGIPLLLAAAVIVTVTLIRKRRRAVKRDKAPWECPWCGAQMDGGQFCRSCGGKRPGGND